MLTEALGKAAQLIKTARFPIALTGAGCSTESGIPDFRSAGGLWSRFDPMEYATIGSFRKDPEKVWQMLNELVGIVGAEPNQGHIAMARLEKAGLLQGIITQNIDGLHQKAGSQSVIEFHGGLTTFSCLDCGASFSLDAVKNAVPPRCTSCRTLLKPDIVFFDEQIPGPSLEAAQDLIARADLLLVAGTSCQVIPASYFPEMMRNKGGILIEINLEPAIPHLAEVTLAGKFSKIMTALADQLQAWQQ